MNCPRCNSENVDQTGKFDLTVIDARECRHDFECADCECLFQIVYRPISTIVVKSEEESEAAST